MLFLTIGAEFSENIESIQVQDTDDNVAEYTFDLECTNCHEMHDSKVLINTKESHEMPGSRGEASFILKCKFCSKDCSVNLEPYETFLYSSSSEEVNSKEKRKKHGLNKLGVDKAAILQLDCRGCEPKGFYWNNLTFLVKLNSGKIMECQFDQDENEWYDYDDDSSEEVNITEFQCEFVKGK